MNLIPVSLAEARRFIAQHHRHSGPPVGWKFGVGIEQDGKLIGVAVAGVPRSRNLMQADPYLLEVNRTCTDGTVNANSKLYGAIARAAKALGYRTLVTYTIESESGASLRAAGWVCEGHAGNKGTNWESRPNRPQYDLFGNARRPSEQRIRWKRDL